MMRHGLYESLLWLAMRTGCFGVAEQAMLLQS
jgi:hypothetical protein